MAKANFPRKKKPKTTQNESYFSMNKYHVLEIIGEGSFGKVYKVCGGRVLYVGLYLENRCKFVPLHVWRSYVSISLFAI